MSASNLHRVDGPALALFDATAILAFYSGAGPHQTLTIEPLPVMHVACFAFGLYAASFAVHWLWWRVRLPRRQSAALLLIFMSMLAAALLASWLAPPLRAWSVWGFWPWMQVGLFHVSLTLAYIVAYSALEERSPSMTLLLHVADSAGRGRTREELNAVLGDASPLELRLAAMLRDGMLEREANGFRITPKGRAWASTFGRYRRLLRLGKGG